MTHAQRNAAISKKIEAYTRQFTTTKATAKAALAREGVDVRGKSNRKKAAAVAA